jgi:hypothetical protein
VCGRRYGVAEQPDEQRERQRRDDAVGHVDGRTVREVDAHDPVVVHLQADDVVRRAE